MPDAVVYAHNSANKDFIRTEWHRFAMQVLGEKDHLDIILFPAEEMHELHFYAEKGLITLTETETGGYNITKGKVVCFEKKQSIYLKLRQKLIGATVEQLDIGVYLRSKYAGLATKSVKTFPVDVVNLDYDGNLSKNSVKMPELSDLIFKFQGLHQKSFSLFLTWPETENEDEEEYKALLRNTINSNLNDPRAVNFTEIFSQKHDTIDNLNYDNLSIIGMLKIIMSNSSNNHYSLHDNIFYIYGGSNNRKKMYSVLLNFEHQPDTPSHQLYTADVSKTLDDIVTLN